MLRHLRRSELRFRRAGGWWVTGAFAISRVAAAIAGVRYDLSSLPSTWQFVDPVLLKDHLVESVWYSHTQPPMFNLFVGLVLRLAPWSDATSFHLCFLAMGLALTVTLLAVCRTLGAGRVTAIVATVVITCSPAAILYENWLFYTYPMALLVTALVLAVARWVATGRVAWLAVLCAVAGAMVLTRSLFHPLWYLVVVGLALLARRPRRPWLRPATLLAVAVPLLIVLTVVVKNQVLFGSPTVSSWTGMNLERMTTEQLTPEQRARLIADGTLSPQADVLAFFPYAAYEPVVPPCRPAHPDIAVLAQTTKSTGDPNFNDECFLPVFRQAQRDALASVPHAPRAIARAQVASWQFSLQPSSGYTFLDRNRPAIGTYDRIYNRAVLLTVDAPTAVSSPPNVRALYTSPRPLALTIVIALVVVVWSGVAATVGWVRRRSIGADGIARIVIALTTVAVFVLGNALEIGENARFRWMVEPVMLAVLAVVVERTVRRVWRWRPGRGSGAGAWPGGRPASPDAVDLGEDRVGDRIGQP